MIRARLDRRTDLESPRFGVILGSGLGGLVAEIRDAEDLEYGEIPGFPHSTAPGHSGKLHVGRIGSSTVLAFEGRFHRYEGYSLRDITMPVRLMSRLGCEFLVITNACGGMSQDLEKGDLLLLDDHINLIGANPLTGFNIDDWGPRFPDMAAPYDPELMNRMRTIAEDEGVRARPGVYVAVEGPNLETRAEYRMLRMLGADVVGMSTVPEVIVAVHEGLRTAGISVVTDLCDPDALHPVSVEEILAIAAEAEPKMTRLVARLISETPPRSA
ncbi:MAG: purine-nucleoside phosphorylase [Planctomycetes bacterium]|nr:purine-nucleoside phosphorylase [Planctomycetota bacterium]